jgi:protein-S-isoprenylcysteine O-methyltransferase Ste14
MTMDIIGNKVVFFGLLAGLIIIRSIFALIAHYSGLSATFEADEPANQEEQKSSPISIILILGVIALFVSYAVIPEHRNILIFPLPDWLQWLGLALGTISLSLQIWVHITLQQNRFTARASGRNNIVITNGLYSWIRHPLYVALMLLMIGLSLVSGLSWFWLLTLLSIPFFIKIAKKEETNMVQQFGDQYREYMKSTGRFFPRHMARTAKQL